MFRAFTAHPQTVDETYLEHMGSAWGFAGTLLVAAACCFVHGLLPFAFERSGSRRVVELHQRMVTHRRRHAPAPGVFGWADGI
jgi:hypothetical protein